MKALYNRNIKEINISFGSIRVNRGIICPFLRNDAFTHSAWIDLRHKLTRLGQQRAFAATSKGSAIAIKYTNVKRY